MSAHPTWTAAPVTEHPPIPAEDPCNSPHPDSPAAQDYPCRHPQHDDFACPACGGMLPAPAPTPAPEERVTWHGPLVAEQQLTSKDEGWVVNVRLTDEAARQLARDLARRHMTDLILLNRLTRQERTLRRNGSCHLAEVTAEERERVEARLASALIGMGTVQWTLTPAQAETFHEELDDAQREPDVCTVGTCTAYAEPGLSYCGPHEDGI